MRILLTGITGFLGSSAIQTLGEMDHIHLVAATRKLGFFFPGARIAEVGEINGKTDWSTAMDNCEVVIHSAARVHVMKDSVDDPLALYREVNTEGTLNFARQAAMAGVKRFIFISSIKVNGEQTSVGEPFTPRVEQPPIDPYGLSKFEAEIGLRKIAKETGVEVVIIRPPLVYGPGVKANFASMLKLASTGLPLPFGGLTNNQRSMVAIDNLVDLIITCIDHPCAANQTFLVSDGQDLSTAEMFSGLRRAFEKSDSLFPVPEILFEKGFKILGKPEFYQRLCGSLQVDISETKHLLNWQPPFSVEESFEKTAQHYLATK